ncbi:MAG: hypothetical protein ALAOOOJD_00081 [bacterium]|nr:hypothetical protein [bacterium]
MQLCTTTRTVEPASPGETIYNFATKLRRIVSVRRPPRGMLWKSGGAWRHALMTLPLVIISIILFATPLASQTAGTNYNLPLILASGEQYATILVSDGQAGAFVIWHDKRDGRVAIYAQHVNQLSQPTWKTDGILVATSTKDQLALTALADGKNGFLVFWQDLRNDTGDIYGQRVDANGNLLWNAAGVEVNRATGKQSEPQAVSDGEGGAFVLWREFKTGNEDIAVQRLDGDGKIQLDAAGKVVAQGLANQTLGAVQATHDGGFVAIWSDNSAGLARIAARRFDAKANPLWLAPAYMTTIRSTQTAPAAYYDGRGNTFVVWSDDRNRHEDLFAQKIDAAGLPQWGLLGVTICKAANDQTNAQMIGDGSGGIFVAWEDRRSGKMDIYAQAAETNGQIRWQSDGVGIAVVTQEQTQPQIVSDGSGGLICVWTDERNAGTNIVAQRLDKNGKAQWEANGLFITPEGGTKESPAILSQPGSLLGLNGSFIAWEDSRRGNQDIFAQALNGDGGLVNVPPVILSSPLSEAQAGALYNYQVKATDYDSTDPLTLELLTSSRTWLQVNNAKMQLFGTPSASDAGETAVTLAVKDKLGASATQNFVINVISTNRPPQITSKPDTVVMEDQLYSYQIAATDPDAGEVLTYVLQTEANWLKLDNGGKLSGTPSNDDVGTVDVTLRVADKQGAAITQKFSLAVKNVNDPPIFTSQPDTLATVDSLYIYRPAAADVDRGDVVQIIKRVAPEWLNWNTNTRTLQGKPNAQQAGLVHSISLLARDIAGATVEQTFRLRVVANAPLDVTAPAAPQAVQIEPAQWSANKKFTLRWQNPFDPSRVTGAYYKIGAPPTHNQDGSFVPSPDGVTIAELELLATQEGTRPVYLWLVDGRGNTDFRTAATMTYRYDATMPAAPKNLAPDRQWSRGDSLLLQWQPATDATSGIRRYHFYLDGKFFGFIHGGASSFMLILQLSEGAHGWTFMAEDSAGNLSPWVGAAFKVDRTSPTLQPHAVDTISTANAFELSTRADDTPAQIRAVRLYYRAAGESNYQIKNLSATSTEAVFSIRLETTDLSAKGMEYFFEAVDSAGNRARWPVGAPTNFHALVVSSPHVAAPAPLAANRYQLFSVPYRLGDGAPEQIFADEWGNYDPTVWRLFQYQAGVGNVEFGKPEFENIEPGRAFWLITAAPQNVGAGPVHSIRTDAPFELTLKPGWNLIATPFDFPTAWAAVEKPAGVENNLWAFDGVKYLDQQENLLPWQGYFVRNLETVPQTINILPAAAPAGVDKSFAAVAETDWQVQLRVSDGEFSDETNYLGVAPQAAENWDARDLSEPPAIGEHVSLYFDHNEWPRYPGNFTRDFRPATDALQKWAFTVTTTRPGLPIELRWNFSGNFPADWLFVLQDVDGQRRQQIRPEDSRADGNYIFRATPQARRFIWWAGKKDLLAEAGALQNLIPATFTLAPSYPNPLRLSALPQTGAIRFGLPAASAVRLTIFDMIGRTVQTLVDNKNFAAGYHEVHWNGRDHAGRAVTAGIYIYRLETANFSASRKLILLR